MARKLFRGTRPRIFIVDTLDAKKRRVFVWAWTKWFERITGPSGDVAFQPVADSEDELRHWLEQQMHDHVDLIEMEGERASDICDEFLEQTPLYPEAPELSVEEPFREQRVDEDIEHY